QVLPRFTVRQVAATLNLWDGQTAVLGGLPVENYVNGVVVKRKTTASGKELVIFVTATIVDPAGNRVHSDDELLFNPVTIPVQPAVSRNGTGETTVQAANGPLSAAVVTPVN